MRTRIKICGITTPEDGLAAARAGADAIGFICYPPSPRYVEPPIARQIAMQIPPFVARVAVFVNPSAKDVAAVIDSAGIDLLQFHGDEDPAFCASFGLPYLKAARMRPDLDLLEYLAPFRGAVGWLLDTYRENLYGGIGDAFDWVRIPGALERPIVLSGGLDITNVRAGIERVRPWAVDVSSGVEIEENGTIVRGRKDHLKIERFVAEVRNAEK
ncbi:MAG: phosphoribosylanthranilate isomerase [Betaproteobacteria bacterium]|nr:phosphoribosylanthranilate isomerase [Betaproteobacteria bacterium]